MKAIDHQLGQSLVNTKVFLRSRADKWKACYMFCQHLLEILYLYEISNPALTLCKAQSDFSGVLFSLTIRGNDLDKFTSARKYVFSV